MRIILLFSIIFSISWHANAQIFKAYNEGYYYDNAGQKISGLINFEPYKDQIRFKTDKDADSKKIDIQDIRSIVMLSPYKDSLTVMTQDGKENKKYFARYRFETPTMRFYDKFILYNVGGSQLTTRYGPNGSSSTGWKMSPMYSNTANMVMYLEGGTTYQLTQKNYIEVLSKACADVPEFVQQLQKKRFRSLSFSEMFDEYRRERIKLQNTPATINLDSGG